MLPTRPRWTPSGYYYYDATDKGSSSSTQVHDERSKVGGPYLDHDVRAFVIGGHGRYFLVWLMQLTMGEEREMGRCEKERADFK